MIQLSSFAQQLDDCPQGKEGWSQFENLCTEILECLFVPPLTKAKRQSRTFSGANRRDAIFGNRITYKTNDSAEKNWNHLFFAHKARMILFEYKNYDSMEIGPLEVKQTSSYMTKTMGDFSCMVCSKDPVESAYRQRNTIYSNDQKVILFITKQHMKEMLVMKGRGKEPSDLIIDLLEEFYTQHE